MFGLRNHSTSKLRWCIMDSLIKFGRMTLFHILVLTIRIDVLMDQLIIF